MKQILIFLLFGFSCVHPAEAVRAEKRVGCPDSPCFPQSMSVNSERLPLRSTATYTVLFFDVYTIAHYSAAPELSSRAVLADIPKALLIHYWRGVSVDRMRQGAVVALSARFGGEYKRFEKQLEQMNRAFQDVKRGDQYRLVYHPDVGTKLYLNDSLKTTIPGADFADAYFGIWLSQIPLHKGVRDSLLSG